MRVVRLSRHFDDGVDFYEGEYKGGVFHGNGKKIYANRMTTRSHSRRESAPDMEIIEPDVPDEHRPLVTHSPRPHPRVTESHSPPVLRPRSPGTLRSPDPSEAATSERVRPTNLG